MGNIASHCNNQEGKKSKKFRYDDIAKKSGVMLHIPIAYGVIDGVTGEEIVPTTVFHLKEAEGRIEVELSNPGKQSPVPSLNRGYSAPVLVEYDYTLEELGVLGGYDSDM